LTAAGLKPGLGKTNAAFIRGIGQGDFNLAAGGPHLDGAARIPIFPSWCAPCVHRGAPCSGVNA
jgi:hypothetical protein